MEEIERLEEDEVEELKTKAQYTYTDGRTDTYTHTPHKITSKNNTETKDEANERGCEERE